MAGRSTDNCVCYDPNGKTYNLAPLQRDDGKPSRFTKQGPEKNEFSYNPCRPFFMGPPQTSECSDGDVAICMWSKNPANYINIGKQSTESCGFDKETMTPQMEYSNIQKVVVKLKCDATRKSAEDAKFDVINDREFLLTHNCACPDGCPVPDAPPYGLNKMFYFLFGALSIFAVLGPLIIYCYLKRQDNNDEQQPLNRGDNRVDNANNLFNDLDDELTPADGRNGRQNASQSSSGRHYASSDITVSKEDNFNIRKNRTQNVRI